MNPIRPGRYLASVEGVAVKRARAGHAYLAIRVRVLRDLTKQPHVWIGLMDGAGCSRCGASRKITGHLPDVSDDACYAPYLRSETQPGELVEAIMSTRSAGYNGDVKSLDTINGAPLDLPAPTGSRDGFVQQGVDLATERALRPLVGKLAVLDARETGSPRRRNQDPFVATTWSAPTPLDGFQNPSLPECLALLGRVYRDLKDENTRYHERVEKVLALLETLDVPR